VLASHKVKVKSACSSWQLLLVHLVSHQTLWVNLSAARSLGSSMCSVCSSHWGGEGCEHGALCRPPRCDRASSAQGLETLPGCWVDYGILRVASPWALPVQSRGKSSDYTGVLADRQFEPHVLKESLIYITATTQPSLVTTFTDSCGTWEDICLQEGAERQSKGPLLLFLFCFYVLQIKPRALHSLGKCSTTELLPSP
jgi:hypothetical protein